MCVYSAIHDIFEPVIPHPVPRPYVPQVPLVPPWSPPMAPSDLEKLIEAFRQALAAAKVADEVTKQPDCADPEKATLIERVRELERRLAALEGKIG